MFSLRPGCVAIGVALAVAGCGTAARPTVVAFPTPGSRVASPATTISLRGAMPAAIGAVRAVGARSGAHGGRLVEHSDGDGASFVPSRPFAPGELVTVRLAGARVAGTRDGRLRFHVAGAADPVFPRLPRHDRRGRPGTIAHFVSRPDLSPTRIVVDVDRPGASATDVMVAPKRGFGQPGPMILDRHGRLLWFHRMHHAHASDFRAQRYRGLPVLTWFEGRTEGLHGVGAGVIMDSSYRRIATVHAGNGYRADLHQFVLEPDGSALMTAYNAVRRHGQLVEDGIVQRIDVATGQVMLEWHALDHVPIAESYAPPPRSPLDPYDYFHVNSAQLLPGGDLLISARNTAAVYRVDGRTGAVRWRLGGRHSSFRIPPAARFAWQHDAQLAPGGVLTMFDNHDLAVGPGRHSRALVLRLDRLHRRVHVLRSIVHPRHLLSATQGDAQPLPRGHMFVGWGGGNLRFTEFDRRNRIVFQGRFAAPFDESYRAYRAPWTGHPTTRPAVAIRGPRVYVSWNGATLVRRWRLLAGPRPDALRPVRTVPWRDFETSAPMRGRYVAAVALDGRGHELGRSATIRR